MDQILTYLNDWMPSLLHGITYTLLLTVTGMAVAMVLAIPVALVRSVPGLALLGKLATVYVEVLRGTPLLLQLFYIYFVLPHLGIMLQPLLAATLALGINYSAYLSEVFRGGIAAIEKSQWEAAESLNLPSRITWGHVILPQALRIAIPAMGNYVISMFKDTSLAATVSVTELLFTGQMIGQTSFRYIEIYTFVFVLYLVITTPASRALQRLEKRLEIERR